MHKPDTKEARDAVRKAQTYYAHVRKSCLSGQAWANSELDRARNAYILAQSEYRAAAIAVKRAVSA